MPRSAMDAMFDKVDWKCVRCGTQTSVGCDCWTECRCGWRHAAGGSCNNPVHGVEDAAKQMAAGVAASVLAEVAHLYPEPMKAASGGFRRTLKVIMKREMADALTDWMMAGESERKKAG